MLLKNTMMYNNNFAAAIKVDGKILREFGDTVYLPFGSEYQIRLKNLYDNKRALVHVEIDGERVTDSGLVLSSNETVDLERFIRNGNLKEGNRFKFIERTSKIEDHRGIKLEDGLIKITYEFEYNPYRPFTQPFNYDGTGIVAGSKSSATRRISTSSGTCGSSAMEVQCSVNLNSVPLNDTGITVEGSKSDQSFGKTSWRGSVGLPNTLIIKLLGETEQNKSIREPVTVKTKLECKTCGTINSATSKFCFECGTSLEII